MRDKALQRAAQMREAGYGCIVINVIATKAAQGLLDGCMRPNSSDLVDGHSRAKVTDVATGFPTTLPLTMGGVPQVLPLTDEATTVQPYQSGQFALTDFSTISAQKICAVITHIIHKEGVPTRHTLLAICNR